MKKLIKGCLCMILAIVLLLASCETYKDNVARPSKPSPSLKIVAELPTELLVETNETFEVKIGFGQASKDYKYATLEINATDFEIIDSQGNVYKDKYDCTISDFIDDKYYITNPSNFADDCYYESFTFKYIGDHEKTTGAISVWLTTLQHGEPSTPDEQNIGPQGVLVEFYYTIRNRTLILSTEK